MITSRLQIEAGPERYSSPRSRFVTVTSAAATASDKFGRSSAQHHSGSMDPQQHYYRSPGVCEGLFLIVITLAAVLVLWRSRFPWIFFIKPAATTSRGRGYAARHGDNSPSGAATAVHSGTSSSGSVTSGPGSSAIVSGPGLIPEPARTPVLSTEDVPEPLALQAAYQSSRDGGGAVPACVRLRGGRRPEVLLVRLDVIHRVCLDHETFPDRGLPKDERVNPLSAHLFSLEGQRWRSVRAVMSPAFTPAKLKPLFPLHACSVRDLHDTIRSVIGQGQHADVEMKQLMERFVTDDVGRTLFRVECGALRRPGNAFHAHCAQAFQQSLWRRLRQRVLRAWPGLGVRMPHRASTARYFQRLVDELKATRGGRQQEVQQHPDLLDVLFHAENRPEPAERRSGDATPPPPLSSEPSGCPMLAALMRTVEAPQMFATFRAGFEASAPSLTFALLELAHNPSLQRRLQREVDSVLLRHQPDGHLDVAEDGLTGTGVDQDKSQDVKLCAEMLDDMEFLDCVVKETLRKYPPNATLIRRASKKCHLAESEGSTADPNEQSVVAEGTKLVVPVYAVHHDPALFPHPDRFDPDRFSRERQNATDSNSAACDVTKAYMPFGIGRRHCIARRYALQQVKVGLVAVVSRFQVSLSTASPSLPPDFLTGRGIVLALRRDCSLRLSPRRPGHADVA